LAVRQYQKYDLHINPRESNIKNHIDASLPDSVFNYNPRKLLQIYLLRKPIILFAFIQQHSTFPAAKTNRPKRDETEWKSSLCAGGEQ
jgi:hypothetical protein